MPTAIPPTPCSIKHPPTQFSGIARKAVREVQHVAQDRKDVMQTLHTPPATYQREQAMLFDAYMRYVTAIQIWIVDACIWA
jgi:alkylation response protein AidB-like acyl-CoA dehydrogenase